MPSSVDVPARRDAANTARPTRRVLLAAIVAMFGAALAAGAELAASREDRVKAAFLYNFLRYVEWPRARFTNQDSPLVIGVFGPAPALHGELERTVRGRKIAGRPIVVRTVATAVEAGAAHLLYVPGWETERAGSLLARLRAAPVLAVGEGRAFAEAGGTIVFTVDGDKLRFAVNLKSARTAGITLSSQLVKLATTVDQ